MIFPPEGIQPVSPLDFLRLEELPNQALANRLELLGGYVVREQTLKILVTALKAGSPLLIEGPPGGGKTTLPEALAKAFGLPMAYLQVMKGITIQEILFRWDTAAQNEFVRQAMSLGGRSFEEARGAQWKREFLDLGELVAGYDHTARTQIPSVIIIDEVDKGDDTFQGMLLQLLARQHVVVPMLQPSPIVGIREGATVRPIVFLTSNNHPPGISDPLRSRCYYHYLEAPTISECFLILRARIPAATASQICQTVKLLKACQSRAGDIKHPPQIREILAFLTEIVRNDVTEITAPVLQEYSCTLVKTQKDTRSFALATFALARACNFPDPEIDQLAATGFPEYQTARQFAA
jgi:MoxR-like ATPase